MLIIIEGPDNTGKTTLARHLQEVFSLKYIHCSKPKTDKPFFEYVSMIDDIREPTVVDRAHLGEYVYSQLWRDGCSITDKQFEILDMMCMDRFDFVVVVHATAPNDIIEERCKKNNEKLLKPEQIARCSELFKEIIEKTNIPVVEYMSWLEEPKDLAEKLCKKALDIGLSLQKA